MESVTENRISFSIFQLSFSNALRISLLLPFILMFIHLCWKRWKRLKLYERLPTSKTRLFNFLGHMVHLKNKYLFNYPAPMHVYHSILMNGLPKAYGKDGIFFAWLLYRPSILLYSAESVEMILSHTTEIKKAWPYKFMHSWLGDGLLTSAGSKWRHQRKLLTPAFHFNILKDFLPVMNKQANILVGVLKPHAGSKPINIVSFITKCSFDTICETILGEEIHSQTVKESAYLNSISILTDIVTDRIVKPWFWPNFLFYFTSTGWKYRYHLHQVKKFSKELIARKKKEKIESKNQEKIETIDSSNKEDGIYHDRKRRALLDLLLDEHVANNSISEKEIRDEVDTFTFEGHDTTAMAMSWTLYMVGLHPDIQDKIHAELDSIFGKDHRYPTVDDLRDMKYLECVIKETLRLFPSVPGYARELEQDINFKGHHIPKGTGCMVYPSLLHRDPEVFPNPEKFDPDRFTPENSFQRHPFAYVPFSAGLRNCIGQKYAMMELKCVTSAVLRNYNFKSLQPRDRVFDLFELVLRPYGGLQMEIEERKQHTK